jgi:hypothetical protein
VRYTIVKFRFDKEDKVAELQPGDRVVSVLRTHFAAKDGDPDGVIYVVALVELA